MGEEPTGRLEGGTPFEIRVLRELANINQRFDGLEVRLTNLEEKVEARLHDTRPIWESVLARLDSIEARLDSMDARLMKMDAKFDVVTKDIMDTRADVECLSGVPRPPEI